MILKSFKYSTYGWSIDNLRLGNTNLIVGKNSAGKTRSLNALLAARSIIAQKQEIDSIDDFSTQMEFSHENDVIQIELEIDDNKVIKEILRHNGMNVIYRHSGQCKIDGVDVNPPANQLLMHVQRDVERYPIFENIINWADDTIIRSFIETKSPTKEQLYNIVSTFSSEMKIHVLEMANIAGFPLTKIDTIENFLNLNSPKSDVPNLEKLQYILFKENDVTPILFFEDLSNGMQRTILLFIFIEHIIKNGRPALIAIDDLGEGLDYTRATKVGKLLFEMCEKNNIQLIATSNEELMMNIVNIEKWNILIRHGQNVKSITASDYPKVFEEFKYSGLDNFDFFTSDVFNRLT